jgi:hypothetical protein
LGDSCNIKVFPADRHSCFYCAGGEQCGMGFMQEKTCTNYNSIDKNCITVYGSGKLINVDFSTRTNEIYFVRK